MTSVHRWYAAAGLALLACTSPSGPSEPLNPVTLSAALTLEASITLGSPGFLGLGDPAPLHLIVSNAGQAEAAASFGVCAFLVRGYESASRTGPDQWSYLLPEIGGCIPDLLYVVDVPPNGSSTILLGTIPRRLIAQGSSLTVFYRLSGETTLRSVNVSETALR